MIIGISGKMGTGKTTLANHLAEELGGKRVSFADALRREVMDEFGIPSAAMADRETKEVMIIPVGYRYMPLRSLMQWWGAQRRQADPTYWVKRLVEGLTVRETYIVDDVRYTNEAEALESLGAIIIRLEPYHGWKSGTGDKHPSEIELDGYPFDRRYAPAYGSLMSLAALIKGDVCRTSA